MKIKKEEIGRKEKKETQLCFFSLNEQHDITDIRTVLWYNWIYFFTVYSI